MTKKSYTVVRIPDNDWENLMETVTLDGSYSNEIQNEVWKAIENIQFYSEPWVVIRIKEGKANIAIFNNKEKAEEFADKLRESMSDIEQVMCSKGKYKS